MIGRIVFEVHLKLMKGLLRLGEFKFNKDSAEYRYYREEVMRLSHEGLREIFQKLTEEGVVEKCSCGADGSGWTNCPDCGGSGYKETVTRIPDAK